MPHIHSDSEYDYTVSGHIVYNDTILLIKHKKLPIWTPPSGHIELNETPLEALFKEIQEEAGIKFKNLTLHETNKLNPSLERDGSAGQPIPFDIDVHHVGELPHRHIDLAYILTSTTGIVSPEAGESQEYKWFTQDELKAFTATTPVIRQRALYALDYVRNHLL